jgi:OOP family OmpA-OmpF porin
MSTPVCSACRPGLFVPLLALLALAGMAGACVGVERDVEGAARAELTALGIGGVTVQVSYRSVTLTGPADLEGAATAAVAGLASSGEVTYVDDGSTPVAPVGVAVTVADGTVTLTGSVPDQRSRDTIVGAAVAAYGSERVTDILRVEGVADASPEQIAAVGALASLLAALEPDLASWDARLDGTTLTVSGTVVSEEAKARVDAAVTGLTGVEASADVDVEPTTTPGIDLVAEIEGPAIALSGTVPDQPTRDGLIDAAVAAYGTVTDRLVVADVEPSPELAAAARGLGELVARLAGALSSGRLALVDTTLTVEGVAPRPSLDGVNMALTEATGLTVDGSFGPAPGAADQVERDIAEVLAQESITFETGSAELTDRGEAVVRRVSAILARALRGDPELTMEIGGHTDSVGDDDANLTLSRERAESVRAALELAGIPGTNMIAVGYGETRPIGDNDREEGRAGNRRIEFTVLEG